MKIIEYMGWVFYLSELESTFDEDKAGKWMYYFKDKAFAAEICKKAIKDRIVTEAKHSDASTGVSCFYLNGDDMDAHKRVIQFFLDNNLIQRTKAGKLHNISFKFNRQTRAGQYGKNFNAEIKLEHFVDLYTGNWRVDPKNSNL